MKKFKSIVRKVAAVIIAVATIIPGFPAVTNAASTDGYVALDPSDPIEFQGNTIIYDGQTITLGEKAIYVDGSLSQEVADKYPYVYTSFNEAAANLTPGTEEAPMTVYMAPYVYWIDDPDDLAIRVPASGSTPYGLVIDCAWLSIKGLTKDPSNVVFAVNRGQSQGAQGNYTMFNIRGNGFRMENVTFGNFCNIDLVFPLKPELNRERRSNTITQAQLASSNGDKVVAVNCNFISRLNLMPLNGSRRTLFYNCHFESTDDALNGRAVYLNCDFDFYGNMPFGSTSGTGAVLLNCVLNSKLLNLEAEPNQFFTKVAGPVTVIDSEFRSNYPREIGFGWVKSPSLSLRCYQDNVKHNGVPIVISQNNPGVTVTMAGKNVLNAYKVTSGTDTIYNTYNLLRGNDDWDPMNVKADILAAGMADGKDYTEIPTMLSVSTTKAAISSVGGETAVLTYQARRFGDINVAVNDVTWSISAEDDTYADITQNPDGTCTITGHNNNDEIRNVIVYAKSASGIEAAQVISVSSSELPAPAVVTAPAITIGDDGYADVAYELDLGAREDQSLITWYRVTDTNGSDPMEVAVTRMDDPEYKYQLTFGDVGYYLMAKVEPKNIRSQPGDPVYAVSGAAIKDTDVKTVTIETDFQNFPTAMQPEVKPGFWTVDSRMPIDWINPAKWQGDASKTWTYGPGRNGSVGTGLYQATQGSRLMYTPVAGDYGNMEVNLLVDPSKVAGQGFGSADQYMDVLIKFDAQTMTGYGLRIIRTVKSANAVDFVLVKYENGLSTAISEAITASSYMTNCSIYVKAANGKLTAHAETTTAQLSEQQTNGYAHVVDLEADITMTGFGGAGVWHAGTTGTAGLDNVTMLHNMRLSWEGVQLAELPEAPDNNDNNNENSDGSGNDSNDGNNNEVIGNGNNPATGDAAGKVIIPAAIIMIISILAFIYLYAGNKRKMRLRQ